MRTLTAVGIVAAVLFLIVASIQLADPQLGEREPPEVDFTEPPAEVAADAATQFEYVDYAYRIEVSDNRSGEWRQFIGTWVDHSNRRFRSEGPRGDCGAVIYSTDAISYVRPGPDEHWRVTGTAGTEYPARRVTQPFLPDSIRQANISVVSQDASTITVEANINPMKFEEYYPANSTLLINKSSGLVESVVVTIDGISRTYYLRFQQTETNITVERPDAIPFYPRAVFWDLVRGPLFGLY